MNKQDPIDLEVPSINTQVVVGVVFTGAWMLGVNRKLKTVLGNQKKINDGLFYLNDHLTAIHQDGATVKDVIRLAAATTETKGA